MSAHPASRERRSPRVRLPEIGTWGPIFAFAGLVVLFGVLEPDVFLSSGNFFSILNNQAVLAILACGLTVVLLTGEFDLSIGATLSFTGALSAGLAAKSGLAVGLVVPLVLVIGVLIGCVNGVLVAYFRVPALIATLAVASLLEGFTLWYTDGETIFAGIPQGYLDIGRWSIGDAKASFFYLIVIAFLLWAGLRYTAGGRFLHAIGDNREASRLSGIRVERWVIVAFAIAGLCAAVAGVAQTARNGSAQPTQGAALLLPAFAAAFLGSATLRRGEFHITGTVIGVYLVATGSAGFIILGAPFFVTQLFSGAVLIIATASARFLGRRDES